MSNFSIAMIVSNFRVKPSNLKGLYTDLHQKSPMNIPVINVPTWKLNCLVSFSNYDNK